MSRAHHHVCRLVEGGAAIHLSVLAGDDEIGERTIAKAIREHAAAQGRTLVDLLVRMRRVDGVAHVDATAVEAQS